MSPESYNEMAEGVLDIARERGYTATAISKICYVSKMSASRWLRGVRVPGVDSLFLLMQELRLVLLICETEEGVVSD